MSARPPSKLEEATLELEHEIRRARSFHQEMKTSKTPPHRPPKLSLTTPPHPPPNSKPPRSPGRSFCDNLPLPPRSSASSFNSTSSKSPPRSSVSNSAMEIYGTSRRGVPEEVEHLEEDGKLKGKKSFSKSSSEVQSFEMEVRTPSAATTPNTSSHRHFPTHTASSSPSRSVHQPASPPFSPNTGTVRSNLEDALRGTLPRATNNGKVQTKKPTKEIDPLDSDDSLSSEDEFSFLSKKPARKQASQSNNNDFLSFLNSGPPSPPTVVPTSRRPLPPLQQPASKPLFSFLSLRRSSTAGKATKMTAPASRPMEGAATLPTRGKKGSGGGGGTAGSSPVLPAVGTSSKTDWSQITGVTSRGDEEALSRSRSKDEERKSVQEWKQWASGIASQEAADRSREGSVSSDAHLARKASETIPSASALISEGIISPTPSPHTTPYTSPSLLTASLPPASIPIPAPRRRNSSLTTANGSRLSTSTTTTNHPLSVTKSSTHSTNQSTAPSSPLFAPSTSSLNMYNPPPLPLPMATTMSPFAPLRTRFASQLPKTLLLELLSTLTLFGETFTTISQLPSNDFNSIALRREESFYKSEITEVVQEITDLLGPVWERILRLGCLGGYGPLSRPNEGWGLGRGERFEEGSWWVLRLKRDLEDGLLGGSTGSSSSSTGDQRTSVGGSGREEQEEEWKDPDEGEREEGERVRSDLKEEGRRRYEAWKAGLGVQGVRSATAA